MNNSAKHIVLLGGGYVSVWAYRSLLKNLRNEIAGGHVKITVVCPEEYHCFHGWTAESLTCIIQDENRLSPLSKIFSKAELVQGKVEEINSGNNTIYIKLSDGSRRAICYDNLLLGIGSFDSEDVEGIKEYGYQVKCKDAFDRTKQKIQSLVKQAAQTDSLNARRLLSFAIAGGGFTGVELAANIAEFVNILKKEHPSLKNIKPVIRLIISGEKVLEVLQAHFDRLINYTEKTLQQYGVQIINNNKIVKVTQHGAFLSDGTFIQSSMIVSTIGQSRIILKGTEAMPRDGVKRLFTNEYLQIKNHSNIWGGGDACNVTHFRTMEPCPANALWAIKHGEYAGRNIALSIKKQPLNSFNDKGLGQCASLGIGKGTGELHGMQFSGWTAWILRFFFFNYFMPSNRVMLNEIKDWMYLLVWRKRKGLSIIDA